MWHELHQCQHCLCIAYRRPKWRRYGSANVTQGIISSNKLRQALAITGSMGTMLCELLFCFAILLVFACSMRTAASRAASHDTLTAADPQTCCGPEPCGSALGLAIRLTVGTAPDLRHSTSSHCSAGATGTQTGFFYSPGYSSCWVTLCKPTQSLRCRAMEPHRIESSHCKLRVHGLEVGVNVRSNVVILVGRRTDGL